ncbi:MAG: hypothetical protein ACMUIM_08820, partial [bacterium]
GRFIQPEGFTGSPSEDFYDYNAGLSLRCRWQRSRYMYLSYSFLNKDFVPYFNPDTTDYSVHNSSIGIDISISPQSHFNAEAGYIDQDYDGKDRKREGTSFSASVSTRKEKGSLRIEGSGGFDQDYFSEENLGSSTFNQILGSLNYQMTERLGIFASGSFRWEAFYGDDDIRERKDGVWRANGGLSLSVWRWMNLLLDISHSERNSNVDSYDFEDNRIMLRLTGSYPIVL